MRTKRRVKRGALMRAAPALPALAAKASAYAKSAKAANTKRAYATAWAAFVAWCDGHGFASLPCEPKALALYLSELADRGRKVATLELALVSIAQAHKVAGHPSPRGAPEVQAVRQGIRRTLGVAQTKKAPLLPEHVRAMVAKLPATLLGARDRALLTLGLSGGFRRSELVALEVGDVVFVPEGAVVTLRRGKTDQEGAGRKVGVPNGAHDETCPVKALKRWLEAAAIAGGAVFRSVDRWGRLGERLSGHDVARVVKRSARAAGLDAELVAGHSLRSGFVTAAHKSGASEVAIMRQTGHKSERVMRGYYIDADLFSANAAKGLGL